MAKGKKNPAAVALGKLAASKRSTEELAAAGRRGGLRKAENHKNGSRPKSTALAKSVTASRKHVPNKKKMQASVQKVARARWKGNHKDA